MTEPTSTDPRGGTAVDVTAALEQVARRVRGRAGPAPSVALLLGPGADASGTGIQVQEEIPYRDLPGLVDPTTAGEPPRLLLGRLDASPVVALEVSPGYSLSQTSLPVRLMRLVGDHDGAPPPLLIAGACEALHRLPEPAQVVVLDDHVNLTGGNPLVGPNLDAFGPRFPDMSEAYDAGLRDLALNAAWARRIPLGRGVYVAVTGPRRPTGAECRKMRALGGDFTGSWLVPEVIVARHMGMPVLALLALTDVLASDDARSDEHPGPTAAARADLARLLRDVCALAARDR